MRLSVRVFRHAMDDAFCLRSFTGAVALFLSHKDDPAGTLPTFVIIDFQKRQMLFVVSFSAGNVSRQMKDEAFRIENLIGQGVRSPHSVVRCAANEESFYSFVYGSGDCRYFYFVDYRNNFIDIEPADKLMCQAGATVMSLGHTAFVDPFEPGSFYTTAKVTARVDGGQANSISYLKVMTAQLTATSIFSRDCRASDDVPHACRRFGGWLLSSEFNVERFRLVESGLCFDSLADVFEYARTQTMQAEQVPDEWSWICSSGSLSEENAERFFLQCQRSSRYRFELAPGCIRMLSIEDGVEHEVPLALSKPAHFESGQDGHIYLSCHNLFFLFGRNFFVGPAAIVKLRFAEATMVECGTFSDPAGLRFTSHAVFRRDGRDYFCTFGYPNRLFVVDCRTMKAVNHRDMGPTCLPADGKVDCLVGDPEFEPNAVKALAVSSDGCHVLFPLGRDIVFADTLSLDIVGRIDIARTLADYSRWDPSDIDTGCHHLGILR